MASLEELVEHGDFGLPVSGELTPDQRADVRLFIGFAMAAYRELRVYYQRKGRPSELDALFPVVQGEMAEGGYAALSRELGMKEVALRVAVVRLRARFSKEIRRAAARAWGLRPGPVFDREFDELLHSVKGDVGTGNTTLP